MILEECKLTICIVFSYGYWTPELTLGECSFNVRIMLCNAIGGTKVGSGGVQYVYVFVVFLMDSMRLQTPEFVRMSL